MRFQALSLTVRLHGFENIDVDPNADVERNGVVGILDWDAYAFSMLRVSPPREL